MQKEEVISGRTFAARTAPDLNGADAIAFRFRGPHGTLAIADGVGAEPDSPKIAHFLCAQLVGDRRPMSLAEKLHGIHQELPYQHGAAAIAAVEITPRYINVLSIGDVQIVLVDPQNRIIHCGHTYTESNVTSAIKRDCSFPTVKQDTYPNTPGTCIAIATDGIAKYLTPRSWVSLFEHAKMHGPKETTGLLTELIATETCADADSSGAMRQSAQQLQQALGLKGEARVAHFTPHPDDKSIAMMVVR